MIAVIIPCCNAEATVGGAIESALPQSGAEIIVIDDGSTDGSLAIARGFEPAVRVLTGPNQGASAARNRGIGETTGEWIVFLDADDLLLPETLGQRLATAAATRADVAICDWQELVDDGQETVDGPVRSIDFAALSGGPEVACATHVWATTAALMYRRSLVEKIGGFRGDLPVIQDARFLFDAAYHGARFAHSPHVGARYRVRADSLSRRDPAGFWRDVLLNGTQIEALWQARGPLSSKQTEALKGMYNHAARGLFSAADGKFFEAVGCLRRLGTEMPLHPRIAAPLAGLIGLRPARQLLRVVGR